MLHDLAPTPGLFFQGHDQFFVALADVEELWHKGYLSVRGTGSLRHVAVTADGHAYYEERKRAHQPAEELVAEQRAYVDTEAARGDPEAVRLLQEAAELFW